MAAKSDSARRRIAVAGNPNAGKTSIFNEMTGTLGAVANYPGVTVEIKTGSAEHAGQQYQVIDLPGTYSLTAYSGEEMVARNFVIEEQPEVVLDVVDASNLERNLYLTVQLMEMRAPLVVALNMVDVARTRGVEIDTKKLSALLGVPVVATVGNRGQGVDELMAACASAAEQPPETALVTYGHMLEGEVARLAAKIAADTGLAGRYLPRWLAVKLLEQDEDVCRRVKQLAADAAELERAVEAATERIEKHFDEDPATIIAERRYGFAAGAIRDCLRLTGQARQDFTDRIDSVVCNRYLGPAILGGVVFFIFAAVFRVADEWKWLFGNSPKGWVEALFEWLAAQVAPMEAGWPMLHSLLADAVIRGVGGVISFVPLIFVLFLFVAALEDSGYIARVAFIMDRALKAFGLQGKSILAMIVSGGLGGGGCAVPGIMAARTLRTEKDRLVTIMVAPLMNCGAKMPLYLMLVAAFFAGHKARMLFLLWALSWVLALSAAWLLRKFVIRGEQTPFVMELPPYHLPTLKGMLQHTWERTWMYIKKAGTILLAVNVVLWALMYFPRLDEKSAADFSRKCREEGDDRKTIANRLKQKELEISIAGRIGRAAEPVTSLAGFKWQENIALFGGLAAKEVVVGTLGTAYSMGDVDPDKSESLSERLRGDSTWNPLRAFTMMIFVMIYAPCVATLVVIRRETGSWKWAAFSTLYTTILAFIVATGIYQIGMAMSWGTS
jgi:ferrous iron transport protein B